MLQTSEKGGVVKQGPKGGVVQQGPWLGRDGFVAETAVQFDRVLGTIARLEREAEKSRKAIAELAEATSRTRRFQAFEESLRNSRDYKLTAIHKGFRDLKSRLDAIEGEKSTFVGLTYKTFESIDKKLAELSALQAQVDNANSSARRNAILFCAAFALAAVALASHFLKY